MPERIDIAILRSREELAALAPQWSALCRHDAHATPFQSPEWLLPWARQFARRDLRVIAIRQNGRLIGLVPLYIYTEPRRRERHLLLLGAGTSDYLDGVFAPACSVQQIRAGLENLQAEGEWNIAYFTQLRPNSKLAETLRVSRGLHVLPAVSQSCARMPARCIPDLPRKLRQNVHYYENRARRLGSLELHTTGVTDCLEAFEVLRRMHAERWQDSGHPGVLADPRVIAWHREALPQLARAGTLRLCTLTLDGEPVAALYALADPPGRPHRALYVYLPAFAIQRADLRSGTLLLAHLMEQATHEGVQTVDFLRGEEPYKRLWHAQAMPTFGFSLRPAAALARAA